MGFSQAFYKFTKIPNMDLHVRRAFLGQRKREAATVGSIY